MHRTDAPGNAAGFFTDGNPVTGQARTLIEEDSLNAFQEELMAFLTAAGVTPVKGTNNQVLDAMRQLTHRPTVRNTVQYGAMSSGVPAILATSGDLNVGILGTTVPVRLTFANGFDAYGQVDHTRTIAANTSTLLTASQTCYVYVTNAAPLTYGHSLLAPVYGYTHPGAPATDQHSYLIPEGKMYRWDGAAWVQVQRIFLGKATTSGSAVTAVESFAFNGKSIITTAALAANQIQAIPHLIGSLPRVRTVLVCLTTNGNWAVGDEVSEFTNYDDGAADGSWAIGEDAVNVISATDATAFIVMDKTAAGTQTVITMASWAFRHYCERRN